MTVPEVGRYIITMLAFPHKLTAMSDVLSLGPAVIIRDRPEDGTDHWCAMNQLNSPRTITRSHPGHRRRAPAMPRHTQKSVGGFAAAIRDVTTTCMQFSVLYRCPFIPFLLSRLIWDVVKSQSRPT